MELDTLRHLCSLSRLNYDESELEQLSKDMTDIVNLMDGIKEFDLTYDDTKDNNSISFNEVREDVAQPSYPTEKLLQNAKSIDNCFVVPKVVE